MSAPDNPYAVTALPESGIANELTGFERARTVLAGMLVGFFVLLMLVVLSFCVILLVSSMFSAGFGTAHIVAGGLCFLVSLGTAVYIGIQSTLRIQRVLSRRMRQNIRQRELIREVEAAKQKLAERKASSGGES